VPLLMKKIEAKTDWRIGAGHHGAKRKNGTDAVGERRRRRPAEAGSNRDGVAERAGAVNATSGRSCGMDGPLPRPTAHAGSSENEAARRQSDPGDTSDTTE